MEYNQEGLNLMDNLKMHKEAIKYFDKAIAISPKLPGPYQNKGDALRMLGMFNTAIMPLATVTLLANINRYPC